MIDAVIFISLLSSLAIIKIAVFSLVILLRSIVVLARRLFIFSLLIIFLNCCLNVDIIPPRVSAGARTVPDRQLYILEFLSCFITYSFKSLLSDK